MLSSDLAHSRQHEALREAEQARRARRLILVRRAERRAERSAARARQIRSLIW